MDIFAPKYMILQVISLKCFMVSLYPAYMKFLCLINIPVNILSSENLSEMTSRGSPQKQYKWKTIQHQIIISGFPSETYPLRDGFLQTITFQLPLNLLVFYYGFLVLLLLLCISWLCFLFVFTKRNPLTRQTFHKSLAILYEFLNFNQSKYQYS